MAGRLRRFSLSVASGLALVSAAVASTSVGCSAVLDFEQCKEDLDCSSGDGTDLICSENNECIPRPAPQDVTCTVHSDCFPLFDQDHVCTPAGTCASLKSDECTEVGRPEDVDPNQVVYIGSLMATSPPYDTSIGPIQNAVVLAVEDFNDAGSLPGNKKVGWVACDTAGNADQAETAAQHLVDAGIHAIVGPTLSDPVLAVAENVAIDNDTFVISPTATNKSISDLNDSGLIWRTISSDVYQASALADRVAELDPPAERILVLAKDDGYGAPLSSDFLAKARDALPGGAFGTLRYPDPTKFSSTAALRNAYGAIIADGFEHGADTVVLIGTNEVRDLVLFYLTAREAMNPLPPLPRFVVSHGAVPVMTEIVESSAVSPGFRPTLMGTIEGVSPIVQNPANFQSYNIRYMIRFLDEEPLTASSLGYDAAMVTIFAMAAAGEEAGGVEIAQAMSKLTSGDSVAFDDPTQFVPDILDALEGGGSVDVQGVSGELDFNADGEVRTDLIGWGMVGKDGQPEVPVLTPMRQYVLDSPPATDGAWMDITQ
jgi:ABC-type branched-subunit amino acid transport system substrate-binding protein